MVFERFIPRTQSHDYPLPSPEDGNSIEIENSDIDRQNYFAMEALAAAITKSSESNTQPGETVLVVLPDNLEAELPTAADMLTSMAILDGGGLVMPTGVYINGKGKVAVTLQRTGEEPKDAQDTSFNAD